MLAFLFALYILGFALSVFGIVLDIRERELHSLPDKPFKEILFETFLFPISLGLYYVKHYYQKQKRTRP